MGWNSKPYKTGVSNFTLKRLDVLEMFKSEYYNYPIAMFHFVEAKNKYDYNEAYFVLRNSSGKTFILVVIIEVKDGEIYWKEIEESMGPAYYNCPEAFFKFVPAVANAEWREKCLKRKIKYNYEQV